MAKYVCDFGQVKSAGEKLCSAASDLQSSISNYGSRIESDLSSWNGSAKSSFSSTCAEQVESAMQTAQQMENLGEFIKNAAQSIQDLEEQLAGLSI